MALSAAACCVYCFVSGCSVPQAGEGLQGRGVGSLMATVATRRAVPTRLRGSEELTRSPSGNLLGGLRIRTGCPYPPARGPPIALVVTWLKDPGGSHAWPGPRGPCSRGPARRLGEQVSPGNSGTHRGWDHAHATEFPQAHRRINDRLVCRHPGRLDRSGPSPRFRAARSTPTASRST